MTLSKGAILRWLPAVAWMAVIFWLSSQPELPGPPDPLWRFVFFKTAHFLAYGTLALFYMHALGGPSKRRWALLLTCLYAISDEWHQAYTPGRTARPLDVFIDLCGASVSLYSWPRLQAFIAGKARNLPGRPG